MQIIWLNSLLVYNLSDRLTANVSRPFGLHFSNFMFPAGSHECTNFNIQPTIQYVMLSFFLLNDTSVCCFRHADVLKIAPPVHEGQRSVV